MLVRQAGTILILALLGACGEVSDTAGANKAKPACESEMSRVGSIARWENDDPVMVEKALASDGMLEIRRTSRSEYPPDDTFDVMYRHFYIGDLHDFSGITDTLLTAFTHGENHSDGDDVLRQLRAELLDSGFSAKMSAIDTVWENPRPGTTASFRYANFDQKLSVLLPETIDVAIGTSEEIEAIVFAEERKYHDGTIGTDKYWYSPEHEYFVRYTHDHFSQYVEGRLVSYENAVRACQ